MKKNRQVNRKKINQSKKNTKYSKQPIKRKKSKKIQKIKKVKRRKIRYGRILLVLVFILLIIYLISKWLERPIQNIYVSGNFHLTDQEIIELAGIENYPSYYKTLKIGIQKKLENDVRIVSAKITKKSGEKIYIDIIENYPLFYNQSTNETILFNLQAVKEIWIAPVLLNYVPDTLYETFMKKMQQIDVSILERISEIMYDPNHVDEERFLFTMRDGNYVYLTLETLEKINNYISIYAEFTSKYGNKKGILNLDSGQYFTILE